MRLDVNDSLGARGRARRPGLKGAIGKGLGQPRGAYPGGPWPESAAHRSGARLSAGAIALPGHAGDGAGKMALLGARSRRVAANARGNASFLRPEGATVRAGDSA